MGTGTPRGKSETYRELVQAEHDSAEKMAQRAAQRVEEWRHPSPEEYARRVAQGLR